MDDKITKNLTIKPWFHVRKKSESLNTVQKQKVKKRDKKRNNTFREANMTNRRRTTIENEEKQLERKKRKNAVIPLCPSHESLIIGFPHCSSITDFHSL
jgi:hypothetical protein